MASAARLAAHEHRRGEEQHPGTDFTPAPWV
jgi:hypothetical protein